MPIELQTDFIYKEIEKIYDEQYERLLNEIGQKQNLRYDEENARKISGINTRSTQRIDIGSNQTGIDKSYRQNQKIDPNTKLYQETDQTET